MIDMTITNNIRFYPPKKVNPEKSGGTKPTGPLFILDFNKDGWAAGKKLGGLDESF